LNGRLKMVLKMNKVDYYSFHLDGEEHSELEKFVSRFKDGVYCKDYDEIMSTITEMANSKGAAEGYFRHERAAQALPPPRISGDVRLYCNRVCNDIVILGSGCVKTSQKVQHSRDCLFHFELMNELSRQITQRVMDGELRICNRKFEGNIAFKIGDCYE